MPIFSRCVLKNRLRVLNFSSPHPFLFDDGTVLESVPESTSRAASLDSHEEIIEEEKNGAKIQNIKLSFSMSEDFRVMLDFAVRQDVDIVLVPFPVLQCIRELEPSDSRVQSRWMKKCRVVRLQDRVKKIIFSDKFCV